MDNGVICFFPILCKLLIKTHVGNDNCPHVFIFPLAWVTSKATKKCGQNRTEYCSEPYTSTIFDVSCSAFAYTLSSPTLWKQFGTQLMEMSAESPGFWKWWPRCLNLNVADVSQSQRMGNSFQCLLAPALSAEGMLRKPLACLCPQVDCQCSSCSLLVQSLITPPATFVDMPTAGSGPTSLHEK